MGTQDVLERLRAFVAARDWSQFHTPENLAKSISIEAAELLEAYQWSRDADLEQVKEELADVLTYAYLLADKLGLEPETIIADKLKITEEKYPVEKARGSSAKYDQL
jgi:NTP pyrophosphatase (non-canonical NTP hydrolase)